MADHMEELGIVIRADGTVELANGMKLTADQISGVGKKLDEYGQQLKKTDAGQKSVSTSAKDMGSQTSQAAGKVVQAGKDLANGNWERVAGNIAQTAIESRVLTSSLVGIGLTIGAVVAGLGAVAYAAYEGAKAQEALNNSLVLTGNFAGLAQGQMNGMAQSLASEVKAKVSVSREVLAGLVATGKFTTASLKEAGAAALLLAHYTGQTNDQVVKHFAGMADGVAKWAAKVNESYHFLDVPTFDYIQKLEQQGRKQDAMRIASEALSRHLGGDLTTNLTVLGRTLDSVARKWDAFWQAAKDTAKGLLVQDTPDQRLARLQKLLTDEEAKANVRTPSILGGYTSGTPNKGRIEQLRSEIASLQSDMRQDSFLALRRSEIEQRNQEVIDQRLKKDKPKAPTVPDKTADNYIAQLERQLRSASQETSRYADAQEFLRINTGKFTQAERDKALAIAATIDKMAGKRKADEAELKYLQQMGAARDKDTASWLDWQAAQREASRDREFEISLIGKTTEQIARLTAAREAEKRASTQRGKVLDAFDAGTISADQMNRRLTEIDRARDEEITQRNALLAEEFKPGWQKLLDGWKDTNQLMVDAYNGSMNSIVQDGEDAWVELWRTGKFNARRLVDDVIGEMARLYYRKNIAGSITSGNGLGGILNGIIGLVAGNPSLAQAGFSQTSLGSSGFGTGLAYGNQDIGAHLHAGGVVGREATFWKPVNPHVFANAPRFHTGGIAGDEVPIIARKGEGVFTKEQMANLQPAGAGGATITYAPQINIDARTDRAEVEMLVGRAVRAGQADLLERMKRREI